MRLYNTDFDLVFCVKSKCSDPALIPASDILKALQDRVDFLKEHPEEVAEACDVVYHEED